MLDVMNAFVERMSRRSGIVRVEFRVMRIVPVFDDIRPRGRHHEDPRPLVVETGVFLRHELRESRMALEYLVDLRAVSRIKPSIGDQGNGHMAVTIPGPRGGWDHQ